MVDYAKTMQLRTAAASLLLLNLMLAPNKVFGRVPKTHRSSKTTHISALRFEDPESRPKLSPDAFLDRYGRKLGVRSRRELTHKERTADALGKLHDTYEQRHNGVLVLGGVLKVHRDADGAIYAANGDVFDVPDDLDTTAALTAEEAKQRTLETLKLADAALISTTIVVVDPAWYGNRPLGVRLAYFLRVAPALTERVALFIDAHSGEILDHWNDTPSAIHREVYDAYGGGDLCQPFSFPGLLMREEGNGPVGVDDVNRVYDHAADFHGMLQRAYGRDSIDGIGTPLVAVTRARGFIPCPNAGWFAAPLSTAVFCPDVTADDTIAHEFTHGLIDHTADLLYRNEPGMLNESFADVFGEVVDLLNGNAASPGPPGRSPLWPTHSTGPGTDTPNSLRDTACSLPPAYAGGVRWLHAEDSLPYGGPIRDMWNPTCFDDPDRVGALPCCDTRSNSAVVHSGSGIPNLAFAIATDGRTFNGQVVTAVGLVKTAAVWYRALTIYLTPLSRLRDAAVALDMAASDLVGTRPLDPHSGQPGTLFTADDRVQIMHAIVAVEMEQVRQCPDQDGDAVADACDNCPAIANPDQADNDAQPGGDACDSCIDSDGDGFGNPGFPTNQCPTDNCATFANPDQADQDGDGVGDACEDSDADGLADSPDNCDFNSNPTQADTDLDGIGDACDACTDVDGDGFGDPTFPNTCSLDNCPTVANPGQDASCVPPPANDACVAAAAAGAYVSAEVDTRTATTEFGEPREAGLGATVWYRFTAPKSGRICVSAGFPTAYNAQIDLFPPDACNFSSLPIDSESFDFAPECREPEIELDITQGETRLIRVGQRDWYGDGNGGDLAFALEYFDPCLGDCNGNGSVHVDELNMAISIATGARTLPECDKADRDGDQQVTVDELLGISGRVLNGCPDACVAAPPSSAQANLQVWSATGVRNDTITFPIVLEGPLGETAAFNVDLQYPVAAMTTPLCSKDPRLPQQHLLQSSVLSTSSVRWLLTDTETFPSPTFTDGVVLSCQAQIKSDAPLGTHGIQATRTTVSGAFGNRIASTVTSGNIVVLSSGGGGTCSTMSGGSSQLPAELLLVVIPWLYVHLRRITARRIAGAIGAALGGVLLLSTVLPAQAQTERGTWARVDGRRRLTVLRGVRRTWHVSDVEVKSKTVRGRIAIVGASFMSVGRFEAVISRKATISGKIWSGDDDRPVARIEGGFDGEDFVGVFEAANGERGEWEWSLRDPDKLAAILESIDVGD